MTNDIPLIPEIPSGIREAALRGALVPFIGAGASKIAGCPSWGQLADATLHALIEQNQFTHSQLAQVADLNPRVKLSIAMALVKDKSLTLDYPKLLYPGSGKPDTVLGRELYRSLSKLSKVFVTTNYDGWLYADYEPTELLLTGKDAAATKPKIAKRRIVDRPSDFSPALLDEDGVVVHLHGSLQSPETMILTTGDYVRHYANDRAHAYKSGENSVLTFLDTLFGNRTVLFVGYGLEELEILEYVILKARQSKSAAEAKHYLLQGFFSHEYELMRSLRRYFLDCGIELIPFLRDQKDWLQLLDVADAFAAAAPASAPLNLQVRLDMEKLLDE